MHFTYTIYQISSLTCTTFSISRKQFATKAKLLIESHTRQLLLFLEKLAMAVYLFTSTLQYFVSRIVHNGILFREYFITVFCFENSSLRYFFSRIVHLVQECELFLPINLAIVTKIDTSKMEGIKRLLSRKIEKF